jgi:hypothetical protein
VIDSVCNAHTLGTGDDAGVVGHGESGFHIPILERLPELLLELDRVLDSQKNTAAPDL